MKIQTKGKQMTALIVAVSLSMITGTTMAMEDDQGPSTEEILEIHEQLHAMGYENKETFTFEIPQGALPVFIMDWKTLELRMEPVALPTGDAPSADCLFTSDQEVPLYVGEATSLNDCPITSHGWPVGETTLACLDLGATCSITASDVNWYENFFLVCATPLISVTSWPGEPEPLVGECTFEWNAFITGELNPTIWGAWIAQCGSDGSFGLNYCEFDVHLGD